MKSLWVMAHCIGVIQGFTLGVEAQQCDFTRVKFIAVVNVVGDEINYIQEKSDIKQLYFWLLV